MPERNHVLEVILDTSSLISLGEAIRSKDPGAPNVSGYASALEALVLFDFLHLDQPSVARAVERYPELEPFVEVFPPVSIDKAAEEELYAAAVTALHAAIDPERDASDLLLGDVIDSLALEVSSAELPIERHWEGSFRHLPPEIRQHVLRLAGAFRLGPTHLKAYLVLLRVGYYLALKEAINASIVLHHTKGELFSSPRKKQPIAVMKFFESEVLTSNKDREAQIFGESQIRLPLVANYVVAKSGGDWRKLVPVALELRESYEIQCFRDGIREFLNYQAAKDEVKISETLHSLKEAADDWSRQIPRSHRPTIKTGLGVAFSPLSFSGIPLPRLRKRTSDKILVFVHKLLRGDS